MALEGIGSYYNQSKQVDNKVSAASSNVKITGEGIKFEALYNYTTNKSKVPYAHLAKDGIIEYKGVVFVCDEKTNSICLGDMSNPKDVLNIPLSNGGSLRVNRDNLGDLSKAIGMFSPEDVNLIMRAMAQDAKIQQMQNEIEEDKNSIGDGNTNVDEESHE